GVFRLLVAGTEQVYIQADGAGHAVGQLAEERVGVVDVSPLAVAGAQQATGKRRLAGIVGGKQRLEVRIPLTGKIQAALLHPSLEIFGGDAIGEIENRIIRLEDFHRLLFYAYPLASDLLGKRREVSAVEIG